MPCRIKNPANYNLGDLESHVQGMYDHFDQKYGFQKPPVMVFDSDPGNQSKVLGKTAYYDPQSLEIHVFVDGRHPKDVLRSIAHELIHHRQNLEGRLDTGGYSGPGYYLENDELKEVEHEAMLEGNATMREYEDTVKYKERDKMSLKEWKNNELNRQLLKRFGILKENKKPDFPDVDGDGDTKEPISKAQRDKNRESGNPKDTPDDDEQKPEKSEKGKKKDLSKVPPQLRKHMEKNMEGKDHDKEEMEEGRNNPRTTNSDKFSGHEDRYLADRIHEEDDKELDESSCGTHRNKKNENVIPNHDGKAAPYGSGYKKAKKNESKTLQEAIRNIAKANKVFLNGKRIK